MRESTDAFFTGELVPAEQKLLELAEVSQLPRYGACTSNRKYTMTMTITPVGCPLPRDVDDVIVCAYIHTRTASNLSTKAVVGSVSWRAWRLM